MKSRIKATLFVLLGLLGLTLLLFQSHMQQQRRLRGVHDIDVSAASPGYNLYNTRNRNKVYLLNLEGRLVRRWIVPGGEEWGVHFSRIDQKGNLYAVVQVRQLVKMNLYGKKVWMKKINAHHDVVLLDDGTVVVFDLRFKMLEWEGRAFRVLADDLVFLSPDGRELERYSLMDALSPVIPEEVLRDAYRETLPPKRGVSDFLHVNGIAVAPHDVPGVCRRGDFLLSIRNLDLLVILDQDTKQILWQWGDQELQRQHSPSWRENGNILVFDNGVQRERSRILEINPAQKKIVWEYDGGEQKRFFSKTQGGVQELPNGNFLITEANAGRAFEITRAGELVWNFVNPERQEKSKADVERKPGAKKTKQKKKTPGRIFFMTRYPESVLKILQGN